MDRLSREFVCQLGIAAGVLMIAFAVVQLAGHFVEMPGYLGWVAPMAYCCGVALLLGVWVVVCCTAQPAVWACWPACSSGFQSLFSRVARVATPPPRCAGA